MRYQDLSLWWDAIAQPLPDRAPLGSDTQVDVCIVGAGFTGLWTAHALTQADPTLRIAIVEKEVAGFGASGRNGGWCSALFATSDTALARAYGVPAMRAMRRAMQDTVDVVGASAATEGIDCHFAKGGTVVAARSPAQRARADAEVDEARSLGFGEEDLRWVDATEAEALVGIDGVMGATVTPHCAAIQPALLARGLADAVVRRGVALYEHSEVTRIEAGRDGSPPGRPHRGRHRHGGGRGARRRGLDLDVARVQAHAGAGVLAHGGHRTTGPRRFGSPPGWWTGPPSPTTGT